MQKQKCWLTLYSVNGEAKQVISVDSISHFNIETTNTDYVKIYIYFKEDPSGTNYKAVGYVNAKDLSNITNQKGECNET